MFSLFCIRYTASSNVVVGLAFSSRADFFDRMAAAPFCLLTSSSKVFVAGFIDSIGTRACNHCGLF